MKRFSIAVALLLFSLPAMAITYGTNDGKLHPAVGALVGEWTGGYYPYCSGTLISPTVFLTAAHCDSGSARVYVTFASDFDGRAKLLAGTYYADPLYTFSQDDPHDIAVVVLDQPVKGVTPSRLPAANAMGNLGPNQQFTAVGYGAQENPPAPGGPVLQYYDIREYSTSTLNATNPAWLRLSQNPATGNGGTCYGDSGGPNFLGAGAGETNIVAGITITGDMFCKSTNVIYRTDTRNARAFLSRFVTLP
ncbi:MAG TPA: trypsin-like serine protease [Thermoanaerobaculia bacterium]|jgi:secreted trypsin-like serine protease|nr:trypsin-like serine protease [Thermoanaerobaculia bacterium]